MNDEERTPRVVLTELTPLLAIVATRRLYEEQPNLWALGERGRARTLEDFQHHFDALSALEPTAFRRYVQYCENLFTARGFPLQWLADAWRWMERVLADELPPAIADQAVSVLRTGTQSEADSSS